MKATMGLRQMLGCHWVSRRLQRYLDADPSAPLTDEETARLEAHLERCERCSGAVRRWRRLDAQLSRWSGRGTVDPAAVRRLEDVVARLAEENDR